MPEEDYSAAEVEESSEVFSMIFPPDDETSEVVEPGEESLDLPTSFVSTERSSILCAANTVPPIRCDHFGPILVREFVIERVAIVGFVPDEPLRIEHLSKESSENKACTF